MSNSANPPINQFTFCFFLVLPETKIKCYLCLWYCMMAKDVLSVFACLSISLSFSLNISFGSIRLDTIDELVRANTTICGIS